MHLSWLSTTSESVLVPRHLRFCRRRWYYTQHLQLRKETPSSSTGMKPEGLMTSSQSQYFGRIKRTRRSCHDRPGLLHPFITSLSISNDSRYHELCQETSPTLDEIMYRMKAWQKLLAKKIGSLMLSHWLFPLGSMDASLRHIDCSMPTLRAPAFSLCI